MYYRLLVALVAMAGPCEAQTVTPDAKQMQAGKDKQFLEYVLQDIQAERRLCLNAENIAQAPAVLAFARLVFNDAIAVQNRLSSLISEYQIKVSPEMVQQEASKVAPKSGVDFDRSFMASQVDHESDDVSRFRHEEALAQSQDIRDFATATLPVLRQHLALAQAIQARLDPALGR